MADDLTVDGRYVIPAAELDWRFGPTGGPGGQHANRAHSRAELRFDLGESEVFGSELQERMLRQVSHRAGIVTVIAEDSRSQFRNRQLARKRLAERLREAMIRPTPRRPTKPSRSQRQKRLDEKRHTSERKKLRRPPESE